MTFWSGRQSRKRLRTGKQRRTAKVVKHLIPCEPEVTGQAEALSPVVAKGWTRNFDRVVAEVGQPQVAKQKPAVGVRVCAHPARPRRRKRGHELMAETLEKGSATFRTFGVRRAASGPQSARLGR